jgi:hypothetical protein
MTTRAKGDQQRSETPSGRRKVALSSILPVTALCLSVFSLYVSELARRDVARIDVIKTEYGLFHDLAQLQLQYPLMAHLFTVNKHAYDSVVQRIKAASSPVTNEERSRLLLQERALAHYIFTTYEEAFYLWRQAEGGDRHRAELANADLMYFNDALCSNPRLLWFWDNTHGGKLDRAFAVELREYFQANVLMGCPIGKDAIGPFDYDRKGIQ